jgi:hypothetical protein
MVRYHRQAHLVHLSALRPKPAASPTPTAKASNSLKISGGGGLEGAAIAGGGGLSGVPMAGGGGLDTQALVRTGQ